MDNRDEVMIEGRKTNCGYLKLERLASDDTGESYSMAKSNTQTIRIYISDSVITHQPGAVFDMT